MTTEETLLQFVGKVALDHRNPRWIEAEILLKQLDKKEYLIKCAWCGLPPGKPLAGGRALCSACMQATDPGTIIDMKI